MLQTLDACETDGKREGTARTLLGVDRQLSPVVEESIDRYLSSPLVALAENPDSLAAVGLGFVAFARSFWHLYVPNLPLDPAIGLRAHSNFLGRQLTHLKIGRAHV